MSKKQKEEFVLVEIDGTVTPELNISGTVSVPKEIFAQGEDSIRDYVNEQLCYRVYGALPATKGNKLDVDFLSADLNLDRAEEVKEDEEVEA